MIKIILVVMATVNSGHATDTYQTTKEVRSMNECHNTMTIMNALARQKSISSGVEIKLTYECVPLKV